VRTRLFCSALALICLAAAPLAQRPPATQPSRPKAGPSAQASDLDVLMSQVLANRDQNWKKLQQYILDEQETMLVTGPGGIRLFGGQKEYQWFPRDGFFIRSPTRADGVAISDAERRKEEESFLKREQAREKRREQVRKDNPNDADEPAPGAEIDGVGDILRQTVEPEFVSSAYFLRFKFDEGHYALVGREKVLARDVLKIEYYPTKLFADDPDERRMTREERENREKAIKARDAKETPKQREARLKDDATGARIERQMNKVAKATLWVDPALRQILQYELHNIEMNFLPGRSLMRVDELNASMHMSQPFPDVWLPQDVVIRAGFMTAAGRLAARYDVKYSDYRLASTSARIR
jgi:hypothetical protein